MDGANMNAQVALTSPGHIGADVCHLNLHKVGGLFVRCVLWLCYWFVNLFVGVIQFQMITFHANCFVSCICKLESL